MTGAVALPANADFFLTPFAAIKFAGTARIVDLEQGASNTKFALGVAFGELGDGVLGVEGDVTYVPRFFERATGSLIARSHVLTAMGNILVALPLSQTGYSLRPFLSGGGGLLLVSIDDVLGIFPIYRNFLGVNVGGGAVGPLTNVVDVRFDLRFFKSLTRENEERLRAGSALSFWRAAIGLTIR